jgi:tetratricopeptide (TPR) repeat protein
LRRNAAKFAANVRSDASRFPTDPHALRILVEAERAAGNNDAAAQAVEGWLAVQPNAPLALMHKGQLQIERLRSAGTNSGGQWNAARKMILDANKAAPDNPEILTAYYDSFLAQGVLPPAEAQNALVRAFDLVPQDDYLRHKVASDYERRAMIEDAIATIRPAAFALHAAPDDPKKKQKEQEAREKYRAVGDDRSETAREMLERLEKKLAEKGKAAAS